VLSSDDKNCAQKKGEVTAVRQKKNREIQSDKTWRPTSNKVQRNLPQNQACLKLERFSLISNLQPLSSSQRTAIYNLVAELAELKNAFESF